jgi:alkylhydroperoxidase/carboxymuconolactone decarboxylase family protein YurZ
MKPLTQLVVDYIQNEGIKLGATEEELAEALGVAVSVNAGTASAIRTDCARSQSACQRR